MGKVNYTATIQFVKENQEEIEQVFEKCRDFNFCMNDIEIMFTLDQSKKKRASLMSSIENTKNSLSDSLKNIQADSALILGGSQ